MINKMQKIISKYVGINMAYYIVFISYIVIVSVPLLLFGYLFKCIQFMSLSFIIINTLRSFTYGYHNKSNIKCTIFTYVMLIIFSQISKTIPLGWSFLKKLKAEVP